MQKATFSRVHHDKNYPTGKTPERDKWKKELNAYGPLNSTLIFLFLFLFINSNSDVLSTLKLNEVLEDPMKNCIIPSVLHI